MPLLRKKNTNYSYWTIAITTLCMFCNYARCQPLHLTRETIQQQTVSSTKKQINNVVNAPTNMNPTTQNKQKNSVMSPAKVLMINLKTTWNKWRSSTLTTLISYRLTIARKHQKLLANRALHLKGIYLQLLQSDNKNLVIALKQFITVSTIAHTEYQLHNIDQRIKQLTQRISRKRGSNLGKTTMPKQDINSLTQDLNLSLKN